MKKIDLLLLGFVVYFIVIGYFYCTLQFPLTEIVFLIAPLLAVIGGVCAVRAFGSKSPHGKALSYMTAGIALWFVGEIIWVLFKVVFHIDPYPSIADFFYLVAYPVLLIGVVKEISLGKIEWNWLRKAGFGAILVLVLLVFGYFGIYLSYNPEAVFLDNAIGFLYNFGDVFLIIGAALILMLAFEYQGGRLFTSWLCFLIGMIVMFAADILFAIFTEQYEAIVWLYYQIDLLYIVSYLFMAYALFDMCGIIREAESAIIQKIKAVPAVKKKK